MTLQVIKGYLFALIWLQSWPLLFAILNSAMAYYAKQNGVPVVLSELSQVQLKNSDIATTAGYIAMMIPPLSWAIVKSMGAGFSSAYSHFASSGLSSTSQASSSVVDGNYAFNNMQMENVSGYSWGTNSTTSFGQKSSQLANGGMVTETRDGSMVTDSSGGTSKTPIDLNFTRQIASAQQQMARESEVQSESALQGYNNSMSSAWSTLNQFSTNRGNSASTTEGADNSQSSQDSKMASQMRNAAQAYAKANNIREDQAYQNLMDQSSRGTFSGELSGGAKIDSSDQALGKIGKWATGASAYAAIKIAATGSGSTGSTDTVSQSGNRSQDSRQDVSAQSAKDFKESFDYYTSRKTTTSGNITDNNASSRADQLSASLSSAKNSYEQYTASQARSHEYSEMASRTESMSGQMSENLSQQFANFVRQQSPHNADTLLTDANSPEISAQREVLAREFVKTQVQPKVDGAYQQGREQIGKGMSGIAGGGDRSSVMTDYGQNTGNIDTMTRDANIKDNVGQTASEMITQNKQAHQETSQKIDVQGREIKQQNTELENQHKTEGNNFTGQYNDETEKQKVNPFGSVTKKFKEKAEEKTKELDDKFK